MSLQPPSNRARRPYTQPESPSAESLLHELPKGPHSPQSPQFQTQASPRSGVENVGVPRSRLETSMANKFSLSSDPRSWGTVVTPGHAEPDDYLHTVDPKRDRTIDRGTIFTARGLLNLGFLFLLGMGLLALFAGYPIASYFTGNAFKLKTGRIKVNATGQVASMPGNWGPIDLETPHDVYTIPSYMDGSDMELIFSDEFNTEGRTFYPVNLHYWQTSNLEWYDPRAITTKDGALEITLSKKKTHGMDYEGGMMSTWNKFCFTGGLYQASVMLPGISNVQGLWVRSLEYLEKQFHKSFIQRFSARTMDDGESRPRWIRREPGWDDRPYSYDACDVGTAPNQTLNGLPRAALKDGPDPDDDEVPSLSYLPGQRLSRCTCAGESHPGPVHEDGSYVGRSAPEIDMFEAQVSDGIGGVSQSGQWAPFDYMHEWANTSDTFTRYDPSITVQNSYAGGIWQEATSCVTITDHDCYELSKGCSSVYGFEYKPGFDDAYITWLVDNKKAWTVYASAVGQNDKVQISARPVPQEPMYLIANLGLSTAFGPVDFDHLTFPTKMRVDWIRVYQRKDSINVGCDPEEFPTREYIKAYEEAYTNPNLTTWKDDYKQPIPKNSFLGQC